MVAIACGRCGAAGVRVGRTLPTGWEPYRASDYYGPVWCGRCVDHLLGDVLEQLSNAPAAWWDDDSTSSPDA